MGYDKMVRCIGMFSSQIPSEVYKSLIMFTLRI